MPCHSNGITMSSIRHQTNTSLCKCIGIGTDVCIDTILYFRNRLRNDGSHHDWKPISHGNENLILNAGCHANRSHCHTGITNSSIEVVHKARNNDVVGCQSTDFSGRLCTDNIELDCRYGMLNTWENILHKVEYRILIL